MKKLIKGEIHIFKSLKAGDFEYLAIVPEQLFGVKEAELKENTVLFTFLNAVVRTVLDEWDRNNPNSQDTIVFGMTIVDIDTPKKELNLKAYAGKNMLVEYTTSRGSGVVTVTRIVVYDPNVPSEETNMVLDMYNEYSKTSKDLDNIKKT